MKDKEQFFKKFNWPFKTIPKMNLFGLQWPKVKAEDFGAKKPTLDKKDWVRIRVWHPCVFIIEDSKKAYQLINEYTLGLLQAGKDIGIPQSQILAASVGHVSIESSTGTYLSFWPGIAVGSLHNPLAKAKKLPVARRHMTLTSDLSAEDPFNIGRLPETDVTLYSLDIYKVSHKIAELNEGTKYALVGRHLLNFFKAENCSSAAYEVMKTYSIFAKTSACTDLNSWLNGPVTPTQIATCARAAKLKEIELFPETKEWDKNFKAEESSLGISRK